MMSQVSGDIIISSFSGVIRVLMTCFTKHRHQVEIPRELLLSMVWSNFQDGTQDTVQITKGIRVIGGFSIDFRIRDDGRIIAEARHA